MAGGAAVSATVIVGTVHATVSGGIWTSDLDDRFARACKLLAWQSQRQRAPYDPDPDLSAAHRVAATLGGRVMTSTTPDSHPDRVY
jgi:hypothetical protein